MGTHGRTSTIFSLYISFSLLSFSIAFAFSPIDHYLLDCGSPKPTTVDNNRRFTGDSSDSGSQFLKSSRSISLRNSNPSPGSSPLYHAVRVFTRPSKYAFEIRDRGTHLVRLHFRPFDSSNFNTYDSKFHVSVNGYLLLYNFTVGKSQAPIIKDYVIWVDAEELVITFVPSEKSEIAFVNAIEVISAPKDLVADVAMLVNPDRIERVNGLMKSALETVYRVNVGGPKVTPFNDSLWRTWVPDDEFLKLSDGSQRVLFRGRVKYQIGGACREIGPDNVYNSARVIRSLDDYVPHKNISLEFHVIGGYEYLVRLHFCDIASMSLNLLYFNVYVNGNLAYENLDLSSVTTMALASPFYADFVVNMESTGVLTVTVGPSNMSMSHTIDAILNGVEIMKLNNSMGSLDGEVCAASVLKNWTRRNTGGVVLLIAAMCLLGTALMVMHRRWVRVKNSVGWSPIPVDVSEVNLK
ncbi:hypothetical protein RHSIM_Rhsim01G0164700 [Rhododendron simsii]|uniref:Malectin-like domain-containing protein n=1 Tax=Rhododendron simsii TaxID=118357 RepID=A0A834LWJ0_RHOSS|nr:hypothetical protein RHSIM_Rhsim01G0164700 [Rhododendron simsii]